MKKEARSQEGSPFAFTLIELLVAMAVLALLLIVLLQITTGALNTWRQADGRFQNFVIARSVMELMAGDLQNTVTGANIAHPAEISTADKLQLFTRRIGLATAGQTLRPFIFVGYFAENGSLWRDERAYPWPDRSGFSKASAPVASQATSLCDGVLAFRFAFPDADGVFRRQITGDVVPDKVMLTMAIVGRDAYQQLQNSGKLGEVENSLNALAANDEAGAVRAWDDWLASETDLPAGVRGNLRFFQRIFPLAAQNTSLAP